MTSNVEALCADWLDAKRAETRARDLRVKIEGELAQAFDVPSEGATTHNTENYKIVLGQPIARKIDLAEWEKVKVRVSPELHPIKTTVSADATGCKYLATNEPETWKLIAGAFTATPGKVSVKVEAK